MVFYLLYGILEHFEFRVYFSNYKRVVKKRAGVELNKDKALSLTKLYG